MQIAGGFLDWIQGKSKDSFSVTNISRWLKNLFERQEITEEQRNNLLIHAYGQNWTNFYYFLQQYVYEQQTQSLYPLLIKTHDYLYGSLKPISSRSLNSKIVRSASLGGKKRKRSRSASGRGRKKRQRTRTKSRTRSKH